MDKLTPAQELQGFFSDYHKDYYGFRPRYGSDEQWNSVEWLEAEIAAIDAAIARRKETFEGREELRSEGWCVDETDPELKKRAEWLQQERDKARDEEEREWMLRMQQDEQASYPGERYDYLAEV